MLISKRRIIHALSYEIILLVIIAIALSMIFKMPLEVTGLSGYCDGCDIGDLEHGV